MVRDYPKYLRSAPGVGGLLQMIEDGPVMEDCPWWFMTDLGGRGLS